MGDYIINLDLRRLPDGSHASRLPNISLISVGGQNLRIYSNAIWPKCGPQAVYKNHDASCSHTEESRGSSDYLSQRHFNYSFFNRDIESPQNTSHQLAQIPRFSNKLQEVESNSIQQIVFLGMLVDSVSMQFILPQHKPVQIQKECSLLNTNRPTIRHLSQVLGLLEACRPVVWSAPLLYRQLQTLQISTL